MDHTSTTDAKTPPPQIWPTLAAEDARGLMAFLIEVLGFVEVVAYADEAGIVQHAELAWPTGGGLMMGQKRPGTDDRATSSGSFAAYVVVPDASEIDAIAERVRADDRGGEVIRGPYDTDYGSHDVAVRDPESNYWQFGTYHGAPRP
jgi:uncharacterized glyoxalase superfamily protein PhnB